MFFGSKNLVVFSWRLRSFFPDVPYPLQETHSLAKSSIVLLVVRVFFLFVMARDFFFQTRVVVRFRCLTLAEVVLQLILVVPLAQV